MIFFLNQIHWYENNYEKDECRPNIKNLTFKNQNFFCNKIYKENIQTNYHSPGRRIKRLRKSFQNCFYLYSRKKLFNTPEEGKKKFLNEFSFNQLTSLFKWRNNFHPFFICCRFSPTPFTTSKKKKNFINFSLNLSIFPISSCYTHTHI